MNSLSRKNRIKFILVTLLLLASFLRLYELESLPPPWVDEIPNGEMSLEIKDIFWSYFSPTLMPSFYEGPMIFYFLLPFAMLKKSLMFIRLPIALCSIATIYLTFLIGKDLFDEKVGLLSSFLLAIFPLHLYMGRVAMEHTISLSFSLLFLFFLKKFSKSSKISYLALSSFFAGLSIQSRPSSLFFILATIPFFMEKKSIKRILVPANFLLIFSVFLLGIFPIVSYNVKMEFKELKEILKSGQTKEGIKIFSPHNILFNYFTLLPAAIGGEFLYLHYFSLPLLFLFLYSLPLSFRKKNSRKLVFSLLLFPLLYSSITLTTFRKIDYLFILPIASILISHAILSSKPFVRNGLLLIIVVSALHFFSYFFFEFENSWKDPNSMHFWEVKCILHSKDLKDLIKGKKCVIVDDPNVLLYELRWWLGDVNVSPLFSPDKAEKIDVWMKNLKKDCYYVFTAENCLVFGPQHKLYRQLKVKNFLLNTVEGFSFIDSVKFYDQTLFEVYRLK